MTAPSGSACPKSDTNAVQEDPRKSRSPSILLPKNYPLKSTSWWNFSHFCVILMRASSRESVLAKDGDGRAREEEAALPSPAPEGPGGGGGGGVGGWCHFQPLHSLSHIPSTHNSCFHLPKSHGAPPNAQACKSMIPKQLALLQLFGKAEDTARGEISASKGSLAPQLLRLPPREITPAQGRRRNRHTSLYLPPRAGERLFLGGKGELSSALTSIYTCIVRRNDAPSLGLQPHANTAGRRLRGFICFVERLSPSSTPSRAGSGREGPQPPSASGDFLQKPWPAAGITSGVTTALVLTPSLHRCCSVREAIAASKGALIETRRMWDGRARPCPHEPT